MIVYGMNPVLEALRSESNKITRLHIKRGKLNSRLLRLADQARSASVAVHFDPREALDRLAGTPHHQGVVAEVSVAGYAHIEAILESAPDLLLLVDGVEDPQNLGALLRTAEAAGVGGVILPDRHSCGVTPAVVKASAGAALHLPVARIGNVVQAIETLKNAGFWVVGLDMRGHLAPDDLDSDLPLVVVVGGEDRGIRQLVREHCDFLVSLPLRGKVSSLNLSVAVGVLLYQIVLGRMRRSRGVAEP